MDRKKIGRLEKEISRDFGFLKDRILGIILFGSQLTHDAHEKSDIDVCIVTGRREVKNIFNSILESRVTSKYDVKIFEKMPLRLKREIIASGKVVWSRDSYLLSDYLHIFRKIARDQAISLKNI